MQDLVDESITLLNSPAPINDFGELLQEAWEVKRGFSPLVSNNSVDLMYAEAISAGAIGGKITGAGGGGFLLLFVPPARQSAVKEALRSFLHVPFNFEFSGSQIIFADRESDYLGEDGERRPPLSLRVLSYASKESYLNPQNPWVL